MLHFLARARQSGQAAKRAQVDAHDIAGHRRQRLLQRRTPLLAASTAQQRQSPVETFESSVTGMLDGLSRRTRAT